MTSVSGKSVSDDGKINSTTINWGENSMSGWRHDASRGDNDWTTIHSLIIIKDNEEKICLGSFPGSLDKGTLTIQADRKVECFTTDQLKAEIKLQERKNRNIVLLTVAADIMAVALAAGLIILGVIANSSAIPAGFVVGAGIILAVGAGSTLTGVNKFDSDRVATLQKHLMVLEKRLEEVLEKRLEEVLEERLSPTELQAISSFEVKGENG